jgi:phosphoglycolate phosphatase
MNIKDQGIIFDLDNTLLNSHIDFPGMKKSIAQWLIAQGALSQNQDIQLCTTSQLINQAKASGLLSLEQENQLWQFIGEFEEKGMRGATLEEGVKDTLAQLQRKAHLFVLTNNAEQAARTALKETGIESYFVKLYGREQVPALKPSPAGIQLIMKEHPNIRQEHWLMIGDSWIDGKAAQESGIPFLLYKGKEKDIQQHQIRPLAHITHFSQILFFYAKR